MTEVQKGKGKLEVDNVRSDDGAVQRGSGRLEKEDNGEERKIGRRRRR